MNKTIHKEDWFESIWGITPDIALNQAFWITPETGIQMFHNKTILDVGAGFSDLLHHISENTTPQRMIAVDPIYGTQERDAATFTLNSIQSFIDDILSAPNWNKRDFLLQMIMDSERQKQVIAQYPYQSPVIERYRDIPDTISSDYIFAINVLFALDDPKTLLNSMDQILSVDWEIIMIDYHNRGNCMNQKIKNIGNEIRLFDKYYIAKLRKWDVQKIDWNK